MGMFSTQVVERIRQNYGGGDLAAGDLLDLLQFRVAPGAERASQVLARKLCAGAHSNRAQGGGGAKGGALLYEIAIGGDEYLVHLDGRHFADSITDSANVDLACSEPEAETGQVVAPATSATTAARSRSRASTVARRSR